MKTKLMAALAALALMSGTAVAQANPTVKNVSGVQSNGDVGVGNVDISVTVDQEIENIYGGDANGGNGGNSNSALGDNDGSGGTGGAGGLGGFGGPAAATNIAHIRIENGNVTVISSNRLHAVNNISFGSFVNTGNN